MLLITFICHRILESHKEQISKQQQQRYQAIIDWCIHTFLELFDILYQTGVLAKWDGVSKISVEYIKYLF